MTLLEKSIKHFENLQTKYMAEHNGETCEMIACAIKAMNETKWINVNEVLPNEKQKVIVTGNKKVDCLLYLDEKFWCGMLDQTNMVIAWKPMPEIYVEDRG